MEIDWINYGIVVLQKKVMYVCIEKGSLGEMNGEERTNKFQATYHFLDYRIILIPESIGTCWGWNKKPTITRARHWLYLEHQS